MTIDVNQMKSLTLAYIGDAVYELHIRHHLIEIGSVKPHQLHEQAVKYVSATAQASIINEMIEVGFLSKQEEAIVRRGRNAKSVSIPKNVSVQAYRYSTGFEALIGFLYLRKNEVRLTEVMAKAIAIIKERKEA